MIQKVIYRRKTESLAPGRGLLLNYILWGVEVRGGQQQGSASHPLPLQVPGTARSGWRVGDQHPASSWVCRNHLPCVASAGSCLQAGKPLQGSRESRN